MHILVAYASRHGATQGIAERIAETLRSAGLDAEALPVASVKSVAGYDAFVIGSAAYMFRWLKEGRDVRPAQPGCPGRETRLALQQRADGRAHRHSRPGPEGRRGCRRMPRS